MLYPFSQIISLSYSACADDMGHLERTEQKISLATGVACFFLLLFLLPQSTLQRLELFTDVKGEFCDKKKHDLCRAYRWITTFSYGTKHELRTHYG